MYHCQDVHYHIRKFHDLFRIMKWGDENSVLNQKSTEAEQTRTSKKLKTGFLPLRREHHQQPLPCSLCLNQDNRTFIHSSMYHNGLTISMINLFVSGLPGFKNLLYVKHAFWVRINCETKKKKSAGNEGVLLYQIGKLKIEKNEVIMSIIKF